MEFFYYFPYSVRPVLSVLVEYKLYCPKSQSLWTENKDQDDNFSTLRSFY